jgi:predicted HTH domain antitoxin
MADTVQLNLQVDVEVLRELERIAEDEGLETSDVARRYLVESVRRWKLERAIKRFLADRISLGRAAEEADVALYDMMEEVRLRGISLDPTTPEQAREDLAGFVAELPGSYDVGGEG